MSDPAAASAALFAAIEAHDLDGMCSLLATGADANAPRPGLPAWAPLHEAIEQLEHGGSIEALVLLLRHGARADGAGGDTPLLMALYRGQREAARLLLAAGADACARGPEGDSPLRLCAERRDLAMVEALLRCGAGRTIDEPGGPAGASALGIAAMQLDAPMVALLLRWGADPARPDADRRLPCERLPPRTPETEGAREEAREEARKEIERLLTCGVRGAS